MDSKWQELVFHTEAFPQMFDSNGVDDDDDDDDGNAANDNSRKNGADDDDES